MTTIELASQLGACAVCGKSFDTLDAITRETLAVCERLAASNPAVLSAILRMNYLCDRCTERMEKDTKKETEQARQQHIHAFYVKGLLPKEGESCRFDVSDRAVEDRTPEAWLWGREWMHRDGNAWVWGPTRTGKTYLALCLAHRSLTLGMTAGYCPAVAINRYARNYRTNDTVESWCSVDFLVLDHIDQPRWNEAGYDCLWYVLDQRYRDKHRTVITSVLDPDKMPLMFGRATYNSQDRRDTLYSRMLPMHRLPLNPPPRPQQTYLNGATATMEREELD